MEEPCPVVGDFYGTEIEIWACFSCFHGQKIYRTRSIITRGLFILTPFFRSREVNI